MRLLLLNQPMPSLAAAVYTAVNPLRVLLGPVTSNDPFSRWQWFWA